MALQYLVVPTLFVVAACADDRGAPAAEPPAKPRVIALHDATGAVTLELSVTADRCTASGATDLAVVRQDQTVLGTMGTTTILTLAPGPAGPLLSDADGTTRMRVVDQPTRLDLVQPDGIPIAAIIGGDGRANLLDGARARVLDVTPNGDHVLVTAADTTETVRGTDDLVLAAVLAFQGLPPDVRAFLACARALPAPAAPDLP